MTDIFVNLKRFDVPVEYGGICPDDNPVKWAEWVIEESARLGIGRIDDLRIVYFFPEALIPAATAKAATVSPERLGRIAIGCQSVFRDDVDPEGNFGAFTSNLPAAAARCLGCNWTLVGHSEERKDKLGIMAAFDADIEKKPETALAANKALHNLLNRELIRAMGQGLNVLYCIGETAEERGDGSFEEQKARIKRILTDQILLGLAGMKESLKEGCELVIAYEPRWAIGPGKTPPGPDYIAYVSNLIKDIVLEAFGFSPKILYGGGLKRENAKDIADVATIDGGLVALTKFTQPVAFDPAEFEVIIKSYMGVSIQ